MKFSNGCWLQKEGCECFSPAQVYFSKIEPDLVTLCAPTNKIYHRGNTLGGVNLTICISAPFPEVLRIQTFHHMGVQKKKPSFELAKAQTGNLHVQETEDTFIITSKSLRLEVEKSTCAMTFFRGEEKITSSTTKDLAYMKTDFRGLVYDKGTQDAYIGSG